MDLAQLHTIGKIEKRKNNYQTEPTSKMEELGKGEGGGGVEGRERGASEHDRNQPDKNSTYHGLDEGIGSSHIRQNTLLSARKNADR